MTHREKPLLHDPESNEKIADCLERIADDHTEKRPPPDRPGQFWCDHYKQWFDTDSGWGD